MCLFFALEVITPTQINIICLEECAVETVCVCNVRLPQTKKEGVILFLKIELKGPKMNRYKPIILVSVKHWNQAALPQQT